MENGVSWWEAAEAARARASGLARSRLPSYTVRVEHFNTATGDSGSGSVQTNDPDAVSYDVHRRDAWCLRVARQKAAENGWQASDTVIVRDDSSVAEALATGGSLEPPPPGGNRPVEVEIDYVNTRTGEAGSARVTTNDPDAVSTNNNRHAAWLKRITIQKAKEDGWAVEDTVVTVKHGGGVAAASRARGASGATSDRGGRLSVRFNFVNLRTGEEGSALVQTLDPDAIAHDPASQAAFLRRLRSGHAAKMGVAEADVVLTLDSDSVAAARIAAVQETDEEGLTFMERIASKVKRSYNSSKEMFDHAAAVVFLLRRNSDAADPTVSAETRQASADVLGSAIVANLEKGGWHVKGAITRLFALQSVDPGRREFGAEALFEENEDSNSRALVGVLLNTIAAISSAGVDSEEALLAVTVRSGGARLEAAGEELAKPAAEIEARAKKLVGGGFVSFAKRLAALLATGRHGGAALWAAMDLELKENEDHGWDMGTAVQLMRAGVRDRDQLVKDTDASSAVLVEHVRRLTLELEGTLTDDLGGPVVQTPQLRSSLENSSSKVVAQEAAVQTAEQAEVTALLTSAGLGAFSSKFAAFGCDCVADLCDADIVSDVNLTNDIGMKPAQVAKFRKAVSGGAERIKIRVSCQALLTAAGPGHDVWKLLKKILFNVAEFPEEGKYRKLKESSPSVGAVWTSPQHLASRQLLVAVGFRAIDNAVSKAAAAVASAGGAGRIEIPSGEVFDKLVRHALDFFSDNGLGGSDNAAFATGAVPRLTPKDSGSGGGSPRQGDSDSGGNKTGSGGNKTGSGGEPDANDADCDTLAPLPQRAAGGMGKGKFRAAGTKVVAVNRFKVQPDPGAAAESNNPEQRVLPENLGFLRLRPERAELGACIGEGSFGVVFMGTYLLRKADAKPAEVAYKRIKLPSYGTISPEIVNALTREVQTMQRLNHPNLLRLLCVSDDPNAKDKRGRNLGICLCLERCSRGSLKAILDDKATQLPWPLRVSLACGIARGMAELYSHVPVIQHRDLKSMNVLVSADWTAKVSDFGLARHRSETTAQSSAPGKSKGGTFRWAAPETFDARFTEASDVYSLGVTLWELVTRALPYGDAMDSHIMMAVYGRKERPDMGLVEAGCPPLLRATVERCWAHAPEDRPAFGAVAAELGALDSALRGLGTAASDGAGGGLDAAAAKTYDVFLSHKQADAEYLCLHLYDLLTAKGYRVFLDRKDASKLHNLPDIVRASRCLVFVLSDHIFESKWCLYELRTAVAAGIPLVPVRKDGATWDGKNFPDIDASYIASSVVVDGTTFEVKPVLRELFKIKAIEHSLEYFSGFFDRLLTALPQIPPGGYAHLAPAQK